MYEVEINHKLLRIKVQYKVAKIIVQLNWHMIFWIWLFDVLNYGLFGRMFVASEHKKTSTLFAVQQFLYWLCDTGLMIGKH